MKVVEIDIEKFREIHGKQFKKDEYFRPTYNAEGTIFISEVELEGMSEQEYPWKTELVKKEPEELLKNLSKEEWVAYDKQETEKRLAELNAKLESIEVKK
jgi:hypothetical protein